MTSETKYVYNMDRLLQEQGEITEREKEWEVLDRVFHPVDLENDEKTQLLERTKKEMKEEQLIRQRAVNRISVRKRRALQIEWAKASALVFTLKRNAIFVKESSSASQLIEAQKEERKLWKHLQDAISLRYGSHRDWLEEVEQEIEKMIKNPEKTEESEDEKDEEIGTEIEREHQKTVNQILGLKPELYEDNASRDEDYSDGKKKRKRNGKPESKRKKRTKCHL